MNNRNFIVFVRAAIGLLAVLAQAGPAFAQTVNAANVFGNWTSVAMSADGQKIAAASFLTGIFTSLDGGTNWQELPSPDASDIPTLASSADGSALAAAFYNGGIYVSTNWGTNWTQSQAPVGRWYCLAFSADGSRVAAGGGPGLIYTSSDGGSTWGETNSPSNFWHSFAASADGRRWLAASDSSLCLSTNGGTTWNGIAMGTNATVNLTETFTVTGYYTNSATITMRVTNVVTATNSTGGTFLKTNVVGTAVLKTNFFSKTFPILSGSDQVLLPNVLELTNGIGLGLYGTGTIATNRGTNVVYYPVTNILNAMVLGLNLQASNLLSSTQGTNPFADLIFTNILGGRALGTNLIAPTSGFTNALTAEVVVPEVYGSDVSSVGYVLANTNFVNLIETNAFSSSNAGVLVWMSNIIHLQVAVTNASQNWSAVGSSANGVTLAAAANGGWIYRSTNSGATWLQTAAPAANWNTLAMSSDGSRLVATVKNGAIYTSTDSGASWVAAQAPASDWRSVALSADGAKFVAVAYGGQVYLGELPAAVPQATAMPALQIFMVQGNVLLSWPASATNVIVQQGSSIAGTAWQDLPQIPVVSNGLNRVTLPQPSGPWLFRLKHR